MNREGETCEPPKALAKPSETGTPEPGCQTSPKECIKIGKNREESETVSPQRLQNPPETGVPKFRRDREALGKKVRLGAPKGCKTLPSETGNPRARMPNVT